MACSKDQGKTWPQSHAVNGNDRGGYSAMTALPDSKSILAVWEDGSHPLEGDAAQDGYDRRRRRRRRKSDPDSGNFYAQQIGTTWCQ